ncbi:MAG: beta-galactosidase [Candidatus Brockarchaeota archaeon]|nr:beta-galactosidase [Candidatus Brockarchaeota archaeon]
MVKAEVKMLKGGPTLLLDGKPVFPMLHWIHPPPIEGNWIEEESVKGFAKAGVHINTFGVNIGDFVDLREGEGLLTDVKDRIKTSAISFNTQGEGYTYDFSKLDKQLKRLLDADPEAYVLLRVSLEMLGPENSWWRQRNPGELEIYSDGRAETQSYASKKWLRDCSNFLTLLIRHLRTTDTGLRVIGIHPCAGHAGEWVKESAMEGYATDYSEVMREAFRAWLFRKYGGLNALREAWRDPYIHFNRVEVPSAEEQVNADLYHFRDPSKGRKVIDYFEFLSVITADNIISLCKTIKEASDWQMLAGVFYGYLMELSWSNWFFDQGRNMQYSAYQRSGHLALSKVLASPYVDFIASPYSYGFRGIGGDSAVMSIAESIRLHGKLYFIEDDTRTHLSPPDSKYGRARNARETVSILTRTFGHILTRSCGIWYGGFYQDEEVMAVLSRFLQLGEKSLGLNRSSASEVALIIDEKSFIYEKMVNNLDWPLVYWQRHLGLARMGTPYDIYLLTDLDKIPNQYKCYIFLNTFHLDDAQRDLIKRTTRREGKTSVWMYASGLINRDISAENMEDITGLGFNLDWTEWSLTMLITGFNHPITRDLPAATSFGTDLHVGPVPYVEDPDAEILGTLVYSRGMCVPGMAVKEFSEWKSIYIGAPSVPSNVLRSIASYAGVHIYSYSDDVLYANRNFICMHAVKPGVKRICLPRESDVYETIGKRLVAKEAVEFMDDFKAGETKLYYYGEEKWLETS